MTVNSVPGSAVSVGAYWLRSSADRSGTLCLGLRPLDAPPCTLRPLREDASLAGASLGLAHTVHQTSRTTVDLGILATAGRVRVTTREVQATTAAPLLADEWFVGTGVTAGLVWFPSERAPVGLYAGGTASVLNPFGTVEVDGYSPFVNSFTTLGARFGVYIRRPR
jgi:hypothetical protein